MTIILNNDKVYTTDRIKFFNSFIEFFHDNRLVNILVKDLKEIE